MYKWRFPIVVVVSQSGWFAMKNPTNMDDDWGYPYFGNLSNGGLNRWGTSSINRAFPLLCLTMSDSQKTNYVAVSRRVPDFES